MLLNAAVALLGLGGVVLAALAWVSWRRSGQARLGLLGLGFGLFGAAGIASAWGLFTGWDALRILTVQTLLCAGGVLVVYLAAVKR